MSKKKKDGSQSLADITRGMHHAASSTTALVAQQYLHMVDQFFDVDDKGILQAKMARIMLDDRHEMNVPLVSLVAPKGIILDRMKVSMAVRLDSADVKEATHASDNSNATRSSFDVSFSPKSEKSRKSSTIDIDMEFKSVDAPEGVMRLIDEYTNKIIPKPIGKSDGQTRSVEDTPEHSN